MSEPAAAQLQMHGGELLVVALEASADLHGAAVLRELKALRPGLRVFGSAGPLMRAEGCEALVRAEDLSVMGLMEVLPAIPRILRALSTLSTAARERRPTAALLIDSPDFNLRLAKRLRALSIPVAYFIGPSVWAWRTYRVKQIARDVLRMLVILPFEPAFYAQHKVSAKYVGNPLGDRLLRNGPGANSIEQDSSLRADRKRALGFDPARPLLALLPGSRKQEIARLWQPMLAAAKLLQIRMPALQLAAPVAKTLDVTPLRASAEDADLKIELLDGQAPELLAASDAAVVTSGTATLEAALQLCPAVVVYRTSWLSYWLGRMLLRVKFISLPNLLAGHAVMPELIQGNCTPGSIASHITPLLQPSPARDEMRRSLLALRDQVAPPGSPNVARKVAEEVLSLFGRTPA